MDNNLYYDQEAEDDDEIRIMVLNLLVFILGISLMFSLLYNVLK